MKYTIQYGKRREKVYLDEEGSFMIDHTVVFDYKDQTNYQQFEIRTRVNNSQQELAEYLRFRDETKDLAQAEFGIDHTKDGNEKGYYYVIKRYTIRHKD